MARLFPLYLAISSCLYATIVTPMTILFLASHGNSSVLWIILTIIICNSFFIPITIFMIIYTMIIGKCVNKRKESFFSSFCELFNSIIIVLLYPLIISLFCIGGWRFCSFWYFRSSSTLFRDQLFGAIWNRIQIWMQSDNKENEIIRIQCLFYLFNDIGRINGKSIKPINYYPIHNILPTTKHKNANYVYHLIENEFINNNMEQLEIEKDIPYNYFSIQFGLKCGDIGEWLYFNDNTYHFIDIYLFNWSIFIGFIFGSLFQYIWMIHIIIITQKDWSSFILLFVFDLIFGLQYIRFIAKYVGKYRFILQFYDNNTIQRYLRRQFSYYFRKQKSNNSHYLNIQYESIGRMFTDDIIEKLDDYYTFYCQKQEAKKQLIKYLDINLCKIVLDYLYDINALQETGPLIHI